MRSKPFKPAQLGIRFEPTQLSLPFRRKPLVKPSRNVTAKELDRVTQSMMRERFFPRLARLLNELHGDFRGRIKAEESAGEPKRLFLTVEHEDVPADPLVLHKFLEELGARLVGDVHKSQSGRTRYATIENYGELEKAFGKGELLKFIKDFKPQSSLFSAADFVSLRKKKSEA